ncbi:MAG: glycoside hydrolase family 6 protein [Saccharospirillaceae bacterium]|nr:glycoside hydrolase family 6 protein [Saccharospirillaceae bacterium]
MPNNFFLIIASVVFTLLLSSCKDDGIISNPNQVSTKTDSNANANTPSETNTDSIISTQSEINTDSITSTQFETNTDSITNTQYDTNTDSTTNTQFETNTDSITNTQFETNTDSTTNTQSETNTDSTTNTQFETNTDSTTNTQFETNTDSITNTQFETNTDSATNTQSETNTDSDTSTHSQTNTDTNILPIIISAFLDEGELNLNLDGSYESITYSWVVDGAEIGSAATQNTTVESIWGIHDVNVFVTVGDLTDSYVFLNIDFGVQNFAPIINSTQLLNNEIIANTSDLNGDSLSYLWTVDGVVIGQSNPLIISDSNIYGVNDVLLLVSDAYLSANLTIMNVDFGPAFVEPKMNIQMKANNLFAQVLNTPNKTIVYQWLINDVYYGNESILILNNIGLEGEKTVVITASNYDFELSQTFNIKFGSINSPPIVIIEEIGDILYANVEDNLARPLVYEWSIDGVSISTQRFIDTRTLVNTGTQQIDLLVTDTQYSAISSFQINLDQDPVTGETNTPIIAEIRIIDRVLIADAHDNNTLSYSWRINSTEVGTGPILDVNELFYIGTQTIYLTVSNQLLETTDMVEFAFESPNFAPEIKYVVAGISTLFAQVVDLNDDDISYLWTVNGLQFGTTDSLALDDTTIRGKHDVLLTVTDGEFIVSLLKTNVTFTGVNLAPVITTVELDDTFLRATATDPENDNLIFNWIVNDEIIGTGKDFELSRPPVKGTQNVTLEVSDSELITSSILGLVNFDLFNSAPENVDAGDNILVLQGIDFTLTGFAQDAQSDELTYTWLINGQMYTGISLLLKLTDIGVYQVQLSVEDGFNDPVIDQMEVTIEQNFIPHAEITVSQTSGYAPFSVQLSGLNSTDDDGIQSYEWTIDGKKILNPQFSYQFDEVGFHTVSLKVTDHINQFHISTINIRSIDPNSSPVAKFDFTFNDPMVTLDASNSSDIDGDTLTYTWDFFDENNQLVHSNYGVNSSYTFLTFGQQSIRLTVEDPYGARNSFVHYAFIPLKTANGGIVIFNENFEKQQAEKSVTGWGQLIGYSLNMAPTPDDGINTMKVTAENAHTGSQGLIVYGSGASRSQNFAIKPLDLSIVDDVERLYVRYFVYADSDYIGNRSESSSNVNYFMSMGEIGVIANEVRIGEIKGALGVHINESDGLFPPIEYWHGEIETPRMNEKTWYCVETAFLNDAETPKLKTWLDGQLISEINNSLDFQNGIEGDRWLDDLFESVKFGWGTYGSYSNNVIFDDIVGSNEYIGCEVESFPEIGTGITTGQTGITQNGGVVIFAEDFEEQILNETPSGWGVNDRYIIQMNPTPTQYAHKVKVVSNISHTGDQALYVNGQQTSSAQVLAIKELDLSVVNDIERVFVRYYVYADTHYIGNRETDPDDSLPGYNYFMSLGLDHNTQIKVGEMRGAIGIQEPSFDNYYPPSEYSYGAIETIRLNAKTWYCVETAFLNNGSAPEVLTWIDDTLIHHITKNDFYPSSVSYDWLDDVFGGVQFGWGNSQSYDNDMYFDDIVASNTRVGCAQGIDQTQTQTQTETNTSTSTSTDTDTDTDTQTDTDSVIITDTNTQTHTELDLTADAIKTISQYNGTIAVTAQANGKVNANLQTLGNPFSDAYLYVNPDVAKNMEISIQHLSGDDELINKIKYVQQQPTSIWLDSIASITAQDDDSKRGLAEHLDAAILQQQYRKTQNNDLISPMSVVFTVNNIPDKSCVSKGKIGELFQVGRDESVYETGLGLGFNQYRDEYLAHITQIISDEKYASLRIVIVLEPDSFANMINNTHESGYSFKNNALNPSTAVLSSDGYCDKILNFADSVTATPVVGDGTEQFPKLGLYADSIRLAIKMFDDASKTNMGNIYVYLDIGTAGNLGSDQRELNVGVNDGTKIKRTAKYFKQLVDGADGVIDGKGLDMIRGFATNVSDYVPIEEPAISNEDDINTLIGLAEPYDFNTSVDMQSYIDKLNSYLITSDQDGLFGQYRFDAPAFIVDTSRNGWGAKGAQRPTPSNSIKAADPSLRVDTRPDRRHWCNVDDAGIGEAPKANPDSTRPYLDAFFWIKTPGESDGISFEPSDYEKGYYSYSRLDNIDQSIVDIVNEDQYSKIIRDVMCNKSAAVYGDGTHPINELAPHFGLWFHKQFIMLIENAYPALGESDFE